MDKYIWKRNLIAGVMCILLIICAIHIYFGIFGTASGQDGKVITIGVFSDSFWGVQNGYSYRILDDAIARFEERNSDVKVE